MLKVANKNGVVRMKSTYQFLQQSKLPTRCFQPSLPRLPIPLLEKTCDRYLTALKPIIPEENWKRTEKLVEKFRGDEGYNLQRLLKEWDQNNKGTSYISKPWFDMYLKDRAPLPLNYNPVLFFKHDPRPEYNAPLVRASNFVISSLRFLKSLQNNVLEPEVFHMNPKKSDTEQFRNVIKFTPSIVKTYVAYAFKAFPLDMSQYNGLFNSTRIPGVDKDEIYRNESARHLLVMREGQFFIVDVLDENGNIPEPEVIMGKLQAIMDYEVQPAEFPIGVMTAGERNTWANVRKQLEEAGNTNQLKAIDSAIFCLCLDNELPWDDDKPNDILLNFMAGNVKNRWFDKSFSVIMEKDGTTAINFEHSWGDGVAILRYFNEIFNDTTKNPRVHPDTKPKRAATVRPLEFNVPDSVKSAITETRVAHEKRLDDVDINVLRNYQLSKNVCKSLKVSPDSVMQLAFQLAYRKACGRFVGTYESCSTSAFRHGRTETMRPCTMHTKQFCDSLLARSDKQPDVAELKKMLQMCSAMHGQLTKEAAMGQGFDRHLFGLKHMAEINGLEIPELYHDDSYHTLNYNLISTSTLGSSALLAGGFGAVVPDGLGVAYSIFDDECGAVATSHKGQCDGKKFIENLEDSFQLIYKILSAK